MRSWGKDLDTLTRLHRALRALDTGDHAEQRPLSAPTLLAPPAGSAADLAAPPLDQALPRRHAPDLAPQPGPDPAALSDPAAVPGGWVSNALVRYTAPGSELVLGPPVSSSWRTGRLAAHLEPRPPLMSHACGGPNR